MTDSMTPYPAARYAAGPPPVTGQQDGDGIWPRAVRELADDLAVDASARDRAGKPPFEEVSRLREAGLPGFLAPPGPEGRGTDWGTACAAVREIAAADSSLAELLARHYVLSWGPRLFGAPEHAARVESRAARERWLWAGSTEAPGTPVGAGLLLTPVGKKAGRKYVLNGQRALAAGGGVADRLLLSAAHADSGESVIVVVDPVFTTVCPEAPEGRLGQRLTGAATVGLEDVPVAAAQVLGTVPGDEYTVSPYTALAPLALRLILLHVGLGNAEGALAEARDISRVAPGVHPFTDTGSGEYATAPGEDPYLLLAYGELATSAHSASSVVGRATDAMAQGLLAGSGLGPDERAEIAFLVAAAEAVATESALHITTRVLELTAGTQAPSPATDPGFDRFWRNARALTTRSSPAHRLRDIGAHYLNGARDLMWPPAAIR
ncbi:acyl-CoA dehydrogenase family protein [Streptomyces ochraceiscleroticus]|uniref:Acyl-CoA dehydrogenase family protein n=1 Tax=Streptomyces ochraceiscleroticus TaxID=47761 RepID=A0ABW1MQM0_9ACTN|nr:acyl-CoA dehydrogenase family protein [Streptomyces ochraceiscleroticus]